MSVEPSILKGARDIAYYTAIEYAWRIGKKAKSIAKFRETLRLILWDISHKEVDVEDLLEQLPVIPDKYLEALRS